MVLSSETSAKPEAAKEARSWLRGGGGQAAAGKHMLCRVAAAQSGLVGWLKLDKADQIKVLRIWGGARRKGSLET